MSFKPIKINKDGYQDKLIVYVKGRGSLIINQGEQQIDTSIESLEEIVRQTKNR